ncbi:response regulator transcription factor [Aliiglaciecola litoralis]|uniref:Response regulator transcription factor n=1 Tax=Aliiglaciecola litoralis TaxID=582857 RepID=A0ABN1LCT0_9ALTE
MAYFLIADDHPLFREALKAALQSRFEGAQFVESDNLSSTLAAIQSHTGIELVLLDLNMPECEDFNGLIQVRQRFPNLPVMVISASDSPQTVAKAMGYGANAFVSKVAAIDTVVKAIQAVLAGDTWIPSELQDQYEGVCQEQKEISAKVAALTPKQFEVLTCLQAGKLNKQIAEEMQVTEATVKAHISVIFKKLSVNTRTQAVLLVEKLHSDM